MRWRWLGSSAAILMVAGAVTSLFFIQFCATVFQCGCQELWGAADAHCNVHNPTGRRCPWCVYGQAGYAFVFGSMIAAQALLSLFPRGWSWPRRLGMALAGFPVSGAILALVLGILTGYWD